MREGPSSRCPEPSDTLPKVRSFRHRARDDLRRPPKPTQLRQRGHPVADTQLPVNLAELVAHGELLDTSLGGDLLVAPPILEQAQYILLSRREPRNALGHPGWKELLADHLADGWRQWELVGRKFTQAHEKVLGIDPLNWDQAAVPGPADHAILDVPGEVTIVVGGPLSVGSFVNHERLVMLGSGSTGMGSLSVFNGAENHGVIALDSVDGAWSSGYFSGATLTNRASGVIEVKAGAGGLRYLSTSIENHGTIRSDDGVFVEADATGLAFRQLGGSVQAVIGWNGGSFDFVDGTVVGFLMLRNTAVTVHETADTGSLLVITGNGASLSGHIPEGVEIWVRGSHYGGHTSVAVQDGTLNDGRIRMEAADAGYSSNLALSGVLTNGPTGVIDSQVGSGGDRVISGTLVNQGLLDAMPFFITYYGTYEVAGGRAVGAVNFFHVTVRQTASPALPNTLRLMGDSALLTDNLANVELWVNGSGPGGTATLSVVDGAVNQGTLRAESTDGG